MENQQPMEQELTEITPAQYFDIKRKLALVTVPLPRSQSKRESDYVVITSNRERLDAKDSSFANLGYISNRNPRPKVRWSSNSMNRFLCNQSTGTVKDAFYGIMSHLKSYIDLGIYGNLETLSLWIVGTYIYRMLPAYPYIHLNGMAGSGKSKTLHLVSLLAFNGSMGAEASPAVLVRLTHDNQSTLCLDEVEKLGNARDDAGKSALAILNVGYKRGASVPKLVSGRSDKDWTLKEFDPYTPKVLAGIQGLEATLASRCISMTLVKSEDEKIVNHEVDPDDNAWTEIRDMIYEGIMSGEWLKIYGEYIALEDSEIKGRNWENWKPLLTIAKYIGGNETGFYSRIREFALEQSKQRAEIISEGSSTIKIIQALNAYFLGHGQQRSMFIILQDFLVYLIDFDTETFKDHRFDKRHDWVCSRWLANEFRKIGLVKGASQQRKVGGKNMKGYEIDYSYLKERMRVLGIKDEQSLS